MTSFIQKSPLDINLEISRASDIASELSVTLEYPETIRFGEEVQFTIKNYEPLAVYTVNTDRGIARVEDDIIYYKAPDNFGIGSDNLFVTVEVYPAKISYFPSDLLRIDYYYNDIGTTKFVQDVIDKGSSEHGLVDFLKKLRKEYNNLVEDAIISTPRIELPNYVYDSSNTLNGDEFKIEEKFGSWANSQRSYKQDGVPVGGIQDYHVPSDIDLSPNILPNLYDLKTLSDREYKFGFKSRNANDGEAAGNVMDGYRDYGEIGSALIVTDTGDNNKRTFQFDIPLDLYDLEGIIPPEIMSLCITSLEIIPVLRGIKEGHTFLWEQISGDTSEVTWISDPTDEVLVINLGKLKTDRVFRFWISKGTKYEKHYDVVIYGTPRDEIVGVPSANNNFEIMGTNIGTSFRETRPILLTAERIWIKEFKVDFIDKLR